MTLVVIAAVFLIAPAPSPSVEDVFVATTEAASEAEGAVCLMPASNGADTSVGPYGRETVGADLRVRPVAGQEQARLIIPKSSNEGGDIPPVRMVVDPYPSFNGVVVDTTNDLVMMSDTNRKSLLVYDRTVGRATTSSPSRVFRHVWTRRSPAVPSGPAATATSTSA